MDQVRVAMRFLAKYHFWFLAALVVIVSLPLWWSGTSAIASAFETSKSAIEGSFKKVEGISPDNPNGTFKEAVDKEHEKLKQATQVAWQQQYDLQTPIFVWPNLPGDFRNRVTALKPTDEIPIDLRGVYQNNIADRVPEIWERCRIRRAKPQAARPAIDPDAAPPNPARQPLNADSGEPPLEDLMTGVVVWTGRSALESQALGMKARTPGTPEIRYFQEDLWIHEVLLRIVDAVNAGSDEPYNAKIKEIVDLRIGQAVAPPVVASAQPAEGEEGEGGGGPPMSSPMAGPGKAGFAGASGGEEGAPPVDLAALLENNRYVDKAGAPQPSGSADAHSSGVFKLIPAEMTLTMEEASVPQLLAACANSSIPVEVRKVTLRSRAPGAAVASTGAGGRGLGGGGPRGFGPPGGLGKGGGGPTGKGGSRGDEEGPSSLPGFQARPGAGQTAAAGDERAEIAPTDVDVYLRVHIYIFNPPDPTKLNLTEASGEDGSTTAEASTEAPAADEAPATEETPADGSETPAAGEAEAAPTEPAPAEGEPMDGAPAEGADAPPADGGEGAPPAEATEPAPTGEESPAEESPAESSPNP